MMTKTWYGNTNKNRGGNVSTTKKMGKGASINYDKIFIDDITYKSKDLVKHPDELNPEKIAMHNH